MTIVKAQILFMRFKKLKLNIYYETIIIVVWFSALVGLTGFLAKNGLTFLSSSPNGSIINIIIFGALAPFNITQESLFNDFLLLLPLIIVSSAFYKISTRYFKQPSYPKIFLLAILCTYIVYSIEVAFKYNFGSGTSIIGVDLSALLAFQLIAILIIKFKAIKLYSIKNILSKIKNWLYRLPTRFRDHGVILIIYIILILGIVYYIVDVPFGYFINAPTKEFVSHGIGLLIFTIVYLIMIIHKNNL